MDAKQAIEGIKHFFAGEHFYITGLTAIGSIETERMQKEFLEAPSPFDHCYIHQYGGGLTGDDYSGHVYFPISNDLYVVADY